MHRVGKILVEGKGLLTCDERVKLGEVQGAGADGEVGEPGAVVGHVGQQVGGQHILFSLRHTEETYGTVPVR